MAGQYVRSASQAGQSVIMTLSLPACTAGDLLVVGLMGTSGPTSPPPTMAAPVGGGVTWVQAIDAGTGFSSGRFMCWYGFAITTGPVNVTLQPNGTFSDAAFLMEFSGVSSILPQPDSVGVYDSSLGTGINTLHNDTLIVSFMIFNGEANGSAVVLSPGFAKIGQVGTVNHPTQQFLDSFLATAWRSTTLAGNYYAQWSMSGASAAAERLIAFRLLGPAAALVAVDSTVSGDSAMLSATSNVIVPAAIFNIPDRYIFDGTDLSNYATMTARVGGHDSHPALRGEDPGRAGLPGRMALDQLPDSRIVTLDLFVHGMNPDGTTGMSEALQSRANLDALQTVLARGGSRPLVRVMPDGSGRQAYAKVWSVTEQDTGIPGALFSLKVDFYLSDPYFYPNTIVAGPVAVNAASVAFNLTHPGTVRGHHLLLDMLGPLTNPRIVNLTTGTIVQFTGVVPSGRRLYIDSEHFSAFLAGVNVVGAITHDGGVPFMWLNPGVNNFTVSASAFGGTITATFAPPYI